VVGLISSIEITNKEGVSVLSLHISSEELVNKAKRCVHCDSLIPHSPRPILIWPKQPKIVLISQAPGRLAHESSLAWNDASGDRLRAWLGVNRQQFYKSGCFAVLPMSFCFPGYKNNADAPPLKPCAPMWHHQFLKRVTPDLVLYIGRYSQQYYLPEYTNLTCAVADFKTLLPIKAALPHPSGRNNRWLSKHSWFEQALVPALQERVNEIIPSN
jgi:uracil-DNA glycosylase